MAKLPSVPEAPASAPKTRNRKTYDNPQDRGIGVGQDRTTRALAAIGALRPLGNSKSYDLTGEQKSKIVSALREAVNEVEEAFTSSAPVSGPRFKL